MAPGKEVLLHQLFAYMRIGTHSIINNATQSSQLEFLFRKYKIGVANKSDMSDWIIAIKLHLYLNILVG